MPGRGGRTNDSNEYIEGSSKDHSVRPSTDSEDENGTQATDEFDGGDSIGGGDSETQQNLDDVSEGKTVKPLSAAALAEFERAQQQAGIIYISRIPPGMRPAKVKHIMSGYGKVGRVFLQQEGEYLLG